MQLFAGELTNQNREYYKVNDNHDYFAELKVHLFWPSKSLLLRLSVVHGGVVNSPRFCFFLFVNVESWATAHGRYRWLCSAV